MDEILVSEMIKKANYAISAGDYILAKNTLLRVAEDILLQAKNSESRNRDRLLHRYKDVKNILDKVINKIDSQSSTSIPVNNINTKIEDKTQNSHNGNSLSPAKEKYNYTSNSLTPQYLNDYIGQPQAVTAVKDLIDAALLKGTAMPHIILYGSHGLGKTTFAKIIANELKARYIEVNVSKINVNEMIAILRSLKPRDIVFIDEIHTLPLVVAESVLYSAMQDGVVNYTEGKGKFAKVQKLVLPPFTLIGATTEIGKLAKPFTQRAIQVRLVEYTDEVLGVIISRSFYRLGMKITPDDALSIARRCRNNPRIANNMVKRISDKALVRYSKQYNMKDFGEMGDVEKIKKLDIHITENIIQSFFEENEIDEYGLEKSDRDLLKIIINRYNGGPVSLNTLAKVVNESMNVIVEKYETYLIKKGFMTIAKDGRYVLPAAYEALGMPVPKGLEVNKYDEPEKEEEIKSNYNTRKVVASLVQNTLKCEKVEALITYPDDVKVFDANLDELFPDITKDYDGVGDTKHLCKLELDFNNFKREIICDSFLESRFATSIASVGFLNDIKAQSLEIPYVSQELVNRRYFPDFIIKDYKNRIAVIEMKNYEMMSYHLNIDKYEKLVEFCKANGYGYSQVMKAYNSDVYISVESIKNRPINKTLAEVVYTIIENKGEFNKADLENFENNNPDMVNTDIYTLLLNDRTLKNVDRIGTNIKIIKN